MLDLDDQASMTHERTLQNTLGLPLCLSEVLCGTSIARTFWLTCWHDASSSDPVPDPDLTLASVCVPHSVTASLECA